MVTLKNIIWHLQPGGVFITEDVFGRGNDFLQRSFQLFAEPILIDSDVWICAQSFVAPGVRIGEGAVIGARSVVTKSQPPWFVCAGNPAKCLKPRDHPRSKSC